jgi:hypothetical protein
MGINKEVKKLFGSSVLNYIIAARTTQGYEESKTATPQERIDIINRWREHKDEYQSSRQKFNEQGSPEGQENGRLTPKGFMQTRHLSFDERKKLHEERKAHREEERRKLEAEQAKDGHGHHRFCPFCRRTTAHTHESRPLQAEPIVRHTHPSTEDTTDHFEEAIRASVAATSRGNADEDFIIERAIRASVRELQSSQGSTLTDEEALNRAVQASIAEAGRKRSDEQNPALAMTDEEAEHQASLEKAIQASLAQYQFSRTQDPSGEEEEDVDTDEDENVKLAIQRSMSKQEPVRLEDEKEIELALQQSREDAAKRMTEEEIVLEYVKKQSLVEEQHRLAVEGKKKEPPAIAPFVAVESGEQQVAVSTKEEEAPVTETETPTLNKETLSIADEEALRLAIEESMKGVSGHKEGASGSS